MGGATLSKMLPRGSGEVHRQGEADEGDIRADEEGTSRDNDTAEQDEAGREGHDDLHQVGGCRR